MQGLDSGYAFTARVFLQDVLEGMSACLACTS